jgi:hypothetical protein
LLVDLPPVQCPAAPGANTKARAYCKAQAFADAPQPLAVESIADAVDFGKAIFEIPADSTNTSGQTLLKDLYGKAYAYASGEINIW